MDARHPEPEGTTNSRPQSWRFRLASIRDGRLFLLIAGPLLALYLATASWGQPFNIDASTNVISSWNLGTKGSFFLDDHLHLMDPVYHGNIVWIVPAGDSGASQYPPGTTILTAPLYAIWPDEADVRALRGSNRPDVPPVELLVPPIAPAALAAAGTVASAMGLLGIAFRRLGANPQMALIAAYLAGLGTSAWSVAADRLWQHGPGMFWIALAALLAERHTIAPGFAYGAAILTRPPTAVIAAAMGLYRSWHERSFRPAVLIGFGALVGLGLFLAYNQWIFSSFSISAGYGTAFEDRALNADFFTYAKNIFLGAFSTTRGFLVFSPFLLPLLPGLRAAWKAAPPWVRGSALGGVFYLLLHYKANRYSGGSGFYSYRYPLEALAAAAPLLFLSFKEWVAPRPRATRAFFALGVASVVLHTTGAVL